MALRRRVAKSGVRWDVEWRLPDGTKRSRTFTTERAAKTFEAELRVAARQGELIDPRAGRITVSTLYERWLASRVDLSVKVRSGYEHCWRLRVQPAFGGWAVSKVKPADVQEWANRLTASGLGPRSVRWNHTLLKMILDYGIEHGVLYGKNPAGSTRFPPLPRTSHVYLTAPEVDQLAALCGANGDVVMILAYSGLRFGELVGLNIEDVDLAGRRLRVRRSMTQVGGRLAESLPKSRAGYRSVPIPRRIESILAGRIEGRGVGEPAVTSPRGFRLSRENWVRAVDWKKQISRLGRPQMRIHDLRHTYASLARAAGADLRLLQKTMGHASITVTANTYSDLYDDELDRVADALDSLREVAASMASEDSGLIECLEDS